MALTCLIYLIIYTITSTRASKSNKGQVVSAAEAVMAPIYPTNSKQLPMSVSHHHQAYTISSQPIMMPLYSPGLTSDGNYMNYISPNPYSTIYPQITNERF